MKLNLIIKIFILIINLLVIPGCENKIVKNDLLLIDIESGFNKMAEINLSRMTDIINYVVLKNELNYPLQEINFIDFSEEYILVSDRRSCLLYDIDGSFIRRIGEQGKGPGEYSFIDGISIYKNKIYIRDLLDLYEFQLTGSFEKKYVNCFLVEDNYYLPEFQTLMINDSLIFGHIENNTGQMDYKAIIININGKIEYNYKNYIKFEPEKDRYDNKRPLRANIYKFDKKIFYLDPYNDTLFQLNSDFKIAPVCVFHFGKYGEPITQRSLPLEKYDALKYFHLENVFQTKNYFLINCGIGDYFPAMRKTPEKIPLPGGKVYTRLYNTRTIIGIYDKITEKLFFSKPTSTDNVLFTSGIYNDIDAGPRFMPNQMVNDSLMVMKISVIDLKKHIASEEFKNSNPKFPEKKKQLEDISNRLSENDNQVLMFVTFKSK